MSPQSDRPKNGVATIRTERLILRPWREEDLEPFAEMNADPEVMRHFPKTLTRDESAGLADHAAELFRRHGFGPWAMEIPGVASFIGFTGLAVPDFSAPFMPCVEVAWRVAREHWGRGYATEAARAAVEFGFESCGLNEIVSFTVVDNRASRRVMEKIGMTHDPMEDFDHPSLPEGHLLRRHVLYRLKQQRPSGGDPAG